MPSSLASAAPPAVTKPDAAALPSSVAAALAPATSVDAALAWTQSLTRSHYENFSVVSALLPRALRQDFCNVYAFCRTADDLADEIADPQLSLSLLKQLAADVAACHASAPRDASSSAAPPAASSVLMTALRQTFAGHPSLPTQPFLDLIDAFEQDRRVSRYQTFDQLLDYCCRSANPVGRIVLHLCGYHDAQRQELSDFTCTALQLANFWQDVRRDLLERDRIYLPAESMQRFGVSIEQIRAGQFDDRYRQLLKFEVDRTATFFDRGDALLPMLDPSVRAHIRLFGAGGRAVLTAIAKGDYDTLTSRPALSGLQKARMIAYAAAAWLAGAHSLPRTEPDPSAATAHNSVDLHRSGV
jgi:squalene synthase HpnC